MESDFMCCFQWSHEALPEKEPLLPSADAQGHDARDQGEGQGDSSYVWPMYTKNSSESHIYWYHRLLGITPHRKSAGPNYAKTTLGLDGINTITSSSNDIASTKAMDLDEYLFSDPSIYEEPRLLTSPQIECLVQDQRGKCRTEPCQGKGEKANGLLVTFPEYLPPPNETSASASPETPNVLGMALPAYDMPSNSSRPFIVHRFDLDLE